MRSPQSFNPQADIKQVTATVLNEAQDMKYFAALDHKRKVVFNYRGLEVELAVTARRRAGAQARMLGQG